MRISITTAADGTGSGTGDRTISGGRLIGVIYNVGTFDATVDVTLATSGADGSGTILTLTNASASAVYYPRVQAVGNTGSALTGIYELPLLDGKPTVTIAQGGNAKTGSVVLIYQE